MDEDLPKHSTAFVTLSNIHCELYELNYRKLIVAFRGESLFLFQVRVSLHTLYLPKAPTGFFCTSKVTNPLQIKCLGPMFNSLRLAFVKGLGCL